MAIEENRLARYAAMIDPMFCAFYYNKTAVSFVTSDCPVCIKRIFTDAIALGVTGIKNIDCIVVYPITPKIAAVLFHRNFLLTAGLRKFENRKCPIVETEIIDTLNRWQFLQCNRQLYAQDSLETYMSEVNQI